MKGQCLETCKGCWKHWVFVKTLKPSERFLPLCSATFYFLPFFKCWPWKTDATPCGLVEFCQLWDDVLSYVAAAMVHSLAGPLMGTQVFAVWGTEQDSQHCPIGRTPHTTALHPTKPSIISVSLMNMWLYKFLHRQVWGKTSVNSATREESEDERVFHLSD